MDLPDTLAAAGKQHGVRFVLSTDSHQPGNLPFMKYAVYLARRAGLEAGDILNTGPLPESGRALSRPKPGPRAPPPPRSTCGVGPETPRPPARRRGRGGQTPCCPPRPRRDG